MSNKRPASSSLPSPDKKPKQQKINANSSRTAPPDMWRDGHDFVTNNKVRDNVRKGVFTALGEKYFPEERTRKWFAAEIENAMSNSLKTGSAEYKDKFRELVFNLRDASNEDLNRKISEGSFTFQKIVSSSSKDLASEAKAAEIEKNVKEAMEAARSDWEKEQRDKEKMAKMMTCPSCEGQKTTLESITKDCKCTLCGHEWNIKEEIEEYEKEKLDENSEDEGSDDGAASGGDD